jgi:hypothetical protein
MLPISAGGGGAHDVSSTSYRLLRRAVANFADTTSGTAHTMRSMMTGLQPAYFTLPHATSRNLMRNMTPISRAVLPEVFQSLGRKIPRIPTPIIMTRFKSLARNEGSRAPGCTSHP